MQENQSVARNMRVLFWSKMFVVSELISFVAVLFYLHRQVSLNEVYYLSIAWSISMLLIEIPSGYLADRIGRKNVLIIGGIASVAANTFLLFAVGFSSFMVIFILRSFYYCCFSGAEEALLYDGLKQEKKEDTAVHAYGKVFSAKSLSRFFGVLIGVLVIRELVEEQFQTLILINVVLNVIGLALLFFLVEPKREKVIRHRCSILKDSFVILVHDRKVLIAACNKALLFIAAFIAWRIQQPLLYAQNKELIFLAIVAMGISIGIFIGSRCVGMIVRRISLSRFTDICIVFIMICQIFMIATNIFWITLIAIIGNAMLSEMYNISFVGYFNKCIPSEIRATTLSNINFIRAIWDLPLLFLAGYLAMMGIVYPIVVSIMLCLFILIFLRIDKKTE